MGQLEARLVVRIIVIHMGRFLAHSARLEEM